MVNNLVASTLHLPCSTVVISSAAGDERDAMLATAMFVSQSPPLVTISVSKTFATFKLIEKSSEFVINVICDKQLSVAREIGRTHGFDKDKFEDLRIQTEPATKIKAPVLAGCFAHLECKVTDRFEEKRGNHMIYVAEVVAFKLDEQLKPVVWLNNRYFNVGAECRTAN